MRFDLACNNVVSEASIEWRSIRIDARQGVGREETVAVAVVVSIFSRLPGIMCRGIHLWWRPLLLNPLELLVDLQVGGLSKKHLLDM